MTTRKPLFKLVIELINIQLLYFIILAPKWLLFIFPRNDPNDTLEDRQVWDDFQHEMRRTRNLVNRVPQSSNLRQLESSTRQLTPQEQDEFRELGNNLLVCIIPFIFSIQEP